VSNIIIQPASINIDRIREKYQFADPKWGPVGYITMKRTYARPLPEENRTEEWWETVFRAVSGAQRIRPGLYTQDELYELYDHLFYMRGLVSGRALWQLGTPLVDQGFGDSLCNCFAKETRVLTRQGWKTFEDLGEGPARLVTEQGKWVNAEIKKFGTQPLMKVTYKDCTPYKKKWEVYATPGHDWIVDNHYGRKLVKTEDLKVGDRIPLVRGKNSSKRLCPQGIQHGLTYGDGTRPSTHEGGASLELIGDTLRECRKYFPLNDTIDVSDNQLSVRNLPRFFKDLPDINESKSYLMGFLAGWIAADGSVSKAEGSVLLFNKDREVLLKAKDMAAVCGFRTTDPRLVREKSPFDGSDKPLWALSFRLCDNPKILVIREDHKAKLKERDTKKYNREAKILSVEKTDRVEEVWCAVVPGTHSFVIEGNALVGNCWWTKINHPSAFAFLFEELMLGGGVGFSVNYEDIYQLPIIHRGVQIKRADCDGPDFIVPDSREGWVSLLRRLLKSYFSNGRSFSYSLHCIRSAGAPIKGFGGKSSGPIYLEQMITKISEIFDKRAGKKLRPIDALDICNIIGEAVVSGNIRRSAELAIGYANDIHFLKAKRWDLGNVPNHRAMSNNSVYCQDIRELPDLFWEAYETGGECYGLINRDLIQFKGVLRERPVPDNATGVNPCLTGETKIFTADGRVSVSIKQLADEGIDVPVFCYDNSKELTIRMMRNPRVTGHNQKILKITLDDGSVFRVTPNHKFKMRKGNYKEACHLVPGESLSVLTRYVPTKDNKKESYFDKYVSLQTRGKAIPEHRLIGSFHHGVELSPDTHIHHKDENRLNNSPTNLSVLTQKEHLSSHITGKANPKFSGVTNEQLIDAGKELTRQLNRRFSSEEWEAFAEQKNLPRFFSVFRERTLGKVVTFSKRCALEVGVNHINMDPRIVRRLQNLLEKGLDARIVETDILVKKTCEYCGVSFDVNASRRERGFCTTTCFNRQPQNIEARVATTKKVNEKKREILKVKQVDIYLELKQELKRNPQKKEWAIKCKSEGLSAEISRASSPFPSWKSLKEAALATNHKVVSIEEDGFEDVYNGTVDDYHNFFVEAGNYDTGNGRLATAFLNNQQCGEIPLKSGAPCSLSELTLPRLVNIKQASRVARLLFRLNKAITCMDWLYPITRDVVRADRRIGICITGVSQQHNFSDEDLYKIYRNIVDYDASLSKEWGVPKSIRHTSLAPSGTKSLLHGSTPGVHPCLFKYYIRRIRMSAEDQLVELCRNKGYKVEPEVGFDGTPNHRTAVVEFPCEAPEGATIASDITAIDQLETVKRMQTHWTDNSCSNTVHFKKGELPLIKDWLAKNYQDSVKTVSFMPHKDHGFKQAPYEEITEEEYRRLKSITTPITSIPGDTTTEEDYLDGCSGGSCPLR